MFDMEIMYYINHYKRSPYLNVLVDRDNKLNSAISCLAALIVSLILLVLATLWCTLIYRLRCHSQCYRELMNNDYVYNFLLPPEDSSELGFQI